jgi:hypothetical protein
MFKIIILPMVFMVFDISCLTLRGKHRLVVLENKMFRIIIEPKNDEVTGWWKNYINKIGIILHFYSSQYIIRITK